MPSLIRIEPNVRTTKDKIDIRDRGAHLNRKLLVERTRAGLRAARERGRIGGRMGTMTPSKVEAAKKLLDEGMPAKEVAQNLGVSVPTLYRWCSASEKSFSSAKP